MKFKQSQNALHINEVSVNSLNLIVQPSLDHFKRRKVQALVLVANNHDTKIMRVSSNLQGTFFEWSLLTKFDCYSKIFEYENKYARMLWTLIFFGFSGVTTLLISKCITATYIELFATALSESLCRGLDYQVVLWVECRRKKEQY